MIKKDNEKQYLTPSYYNRGIEVVRGEGVFLYDKEGRKYLDAITNFGVNILGYGNKSIEKVLTKQLGEIINLHGSFTNHNRLDAILELKTVLPKNLNCFYFSNSGSEAVETAMKYAVLITGRNKFLSVKNDFHGKTLGSLSLSSSNAGKYQKPFLGYLPKVTCVEFDDIKSLKKVISKDYAAFVLEVIQGEGGVHLLSKKYLRDVRKLCDKYGVMLIIDEIQTGLGRTGKMFAFEHHKIIPDIICLGKGLAGGLPVGLTIVDRKFVSKLQPSIHTNTIGGSPFVCSGIKATIAYIKKNNLAKKSKVNGDYFIKLLKGIRSDLIKEVRGQGLMVALELTTNASPYVRQMQKKGILVGQSSDNIIRFLPPLISSRKDLKSIVTALKGCLGVY